MNENMRLQQENDSLAHEIVTTKVGTQERITEVEIHSSYLLGVFCSTCDSLLFDDISCMFDISALSD